ncbi:hypothetical protein PLICRDRAFT_429686 [Plicaturopsis crispa FD-325 SS-3]|nr:hypothetical protein PLICRDRAFT_429686 [Plicaturopsis crispa FD-325 SS-3]
MASRDPSHTPSTNVAVANVVCSGPRCGGIRPVPWKELASGTGWRAADSTIPRLHPDDHTQAMTLRSVWFPQQSSCPQAAERALGKVRTGLASDPLPLLPGVAVVSILLVDLVVNSWSSSIATMPVSTSRMQRQEMLDPRIGCEIGWPRRGWRSAGPPYCRCGRRRPQGLIFPCFECWLQNRIFLLRLVKYGWLSHRALKYSALTPLTTFLHSCSGWRFRECKVRCLHWQRQACARGPIRPLWLRRRRIVNKFGPI